jgi:hypothetical protein
MFTSVLKRRPYQLRCDAAPTKFIGNFGPKERDPAKVIRLKLKIGDLAFVFILESASRNVACSGHGSLPISGFRR